MFITFKFESQRYQPLQVHEMNGKLANLKQRRYESNSQYLERFTNHVETMEACGATIGFSEAMISAELQKLNPPKDIATIHLRHSQGTLLPNFQ